MTTSLGMASNIQRKSRKSRVLEKHDWLSPLSFSKHRPWVDPDDHGTGVLHEHRLQFVCDFIERNPEQCLRIGDLGCGAGALLQRLLVLPSVKFLLGLDVSGAATMRARNHPCNAQAIASGRLQLEVESFVNFDLRPWCLDTLILLETIEHIDPKRLELLEHQLFGLSRAQHVLISTPNADYNPILGLALGDRRHPDHRFEWGRSRFQSWSQRVAGRFGYNVTVKGVGDAHETLGAPSQIAVFDRTG